MRRNSLNFIVDFVSLIAMAGLVATGLIVKYVLPTGSGGRGGGGGRHVWGWSRHDWGDVHFYIALGILALMLVHVVLHWRWVCAVARNWLGAAPNGGPRRTTRVALGLVLLVLVCGGTGGFVWAAARNVEGSMPSGRGRARALALSKNPSVDHGRDSDCKLQADACATQNAGAAHRRDCTDDGRGDRRRNRGGGRGQGNARGRNLDAAPAAGS